MDARNEQVWNLAEPVAREFGCEILDIEFAGAAQNQVLRIYLDCPDKPGGVTLEDCQGVSRRLGDVLEAHEAVAGRYMLEVSSPGVNRRLRLPEHFQRSLEEQVHIRLRRDREDRRNFTGTLVEADDEQVVLDCDGERTSFNYVEIDRANVEYQFEVPTKPGGKRRGN